MFQLYAYYANESLLNIAEVVTPTNDMFRYGLSLFDFPKETPILFKVKMIKKVIYC